MVDPFILSAGWRSPCSLLLLTRSWSFTLVSVRPFSCQMTTTWSFTFLFCCCCTLCTTGSRNSPSIHRYQLSWLQPTRFLLLFLHDDLCPLTMRYRDIPLWYFSSFTQFSNIFLLKHFTFVQTQIVWLPRLILSNCLWSSFYTSWFIVAAKSLLPDSLLLSCSSKDYPLMLRLFLCLVPSSALVPPDNMISNVDQLLHWYFILEHHIVQTRSSFARCGFVSVQLRPFSSALAPLQQISLLHTIFKTVPAR